MAELKKVAELIIIEPPKPADQAVKEMINKVAIWQKKLKDLQDQYFEQNFDSSSPDVAEVMAMRKFLTQFLRQRVEWIRDQIKNQELQKKYLQLLPPFYQKGGVKVLLQHFFQVVETQDKSNLVYAGINAEEKEIRVLWDLYKLNKTIESIDVLIEQVESGASFPSVFKPEKQLEILQNLKRVFKLMFQMCVQPQYQKELYRGITAKHISPEAILKRKEEGVHYLYPHVIDKFNYRNHFFFIYFYSGMKAKIGGEEKTFQYNFLDFEILKQEFLIHWMKSKLAGNPLKDEIYKKYVYEGKSVYEILQANPEREIEILKQLPANLFNDMTAQVNQAVGSSLSVGFEPMSENFGGYAEFVQKFEEAKTAAKKTLEALTSFIRRKKEPEVAAPKPEPEPISDPEADSIFGTAPAPEPPAEPVYELIKVKKNEADFFFFVKTIADFPKQMNLLRAKLGPEGYKNLSKDVTKLFSSISEASMVQRRTPKHEWILPYMVKETRGSLEVHHFLFVGAEVKAKQMGMGYSAGAAASAYQFAPFFVYGNDDPDEAKFGSAIDTRKVRGKTLTEFGCHHPQVLENFWKFFEMIKQK